MKRLTLLFFTLLMITYTSEGQIKLKKKAEKKANQVIDNLLFGKKKKKNEEATNPNTQNTPNIGSGDESGNASEDLESYIPEDVDFGTLDMGKSIHFNVLINILPERTEGFSRNSKPTGARYNTQGVSFSTGSKQYLNGDREMTITLNDYLGAEYFASAQTAQQFEYESTEGYSKSVEINGMNGWISYDNSSKEGTMMLFKDERFYATIQAEETSENELKAIASDLNLSRLK